MSAHGNVIVTGGAGYIGAHACKALRSAGYTPVTYDNLSRGHKEAVKWGPLEAGDLVDINRLTHVLTKYQPVAVMHFAALAYVAESVVEPQSYYWNNFYGSLCLLESMRKADVRKIIFSSTCATYGIPMTIPIAENQVQQPINPYGRTKFAVERMIEDYVTAFDFQHTTFRYFNAAGADIDLDVGEVHFPEPHLIPNALNAASSRGKALQVFGHDYPTADGTCIRDFVHVSDIADAHVLGLLQLTETPKSAYYNLGNDKGHSVLEVITEVEHVTGRQLRVEKLPNRPGDPPILVADSTLVRKELAWSPRYPDLGQMVATAWQWHKKNSHLS